MDARRIEHEIRTIPGVVACQITATTALVLVGPEGDAPAVRTAVSDVLATAASELSASVLAAPAEPPAGRSIAARRRRKAVFAMAGSAAALSASMAAAATVVVLGGANLDQAPPVDAPEETAAPITLRGEPPRADQLVPARRASRAVSTDSAAPVELAALAAEAVDLVADRAAARRVGVSLLAPEPLTVSGDAEGLLRLLSNLLDNAVKYNREGGTVAVRLARADGQARLEVEDQGIGIPPVHLPRIFERFYRVDRGRARAEGGTGLGLAIVKHVAQAHGGRVEVASEPGRGSTFRVYLPLAG